MLVSTPLNVQKKQKKNYSGKKKRHTIKSQIVVDKSQGRIICIHVDKGQKHDYRLFKESRLPILNSTEIQADSGYQGIQKKHSQSKIPHKGRKKCPLTKLQKKENHQLSSTRVLVENIIRTVKIFKIVAEKYRNRTRTFGLRLNLIAAICNFQLC
jgi:IS5 family transposase